MPEGESLSPGSCLLTRAGRGAGPASRAYRPCRRKRADAPGLAAQHLSGSVHVVGAADKQRRPLMQLGGLNVQNALMSIGGGATGLLDDEREWTRLIEKAELPVSVPAIGRVSEETAAKEIAVKIGDEGANVTSAHRLAVAILSAIVAHQALNVRLPLNVVCVVDRQIST